MQNSKTVFPNALLSKQDFQKEQHSYKKCMVFVFMTRWVCGQDGQKQWRNFSLADLKMNMRAFESWKKCGQKVMRFCPEYQRLPLVCKDPTKTKTSWKGTMESQTKSCSYWVQQCYWQSYEKGQLQPNRVDVWLRGRALGGQAGFFRRRAGFKKVTIKRCFSTPPL